MAERELTTKEQKFAKAVALGSSQCEAYSRVYSADASRATKRANGHNISKRPRVAKEIKRLRRLPAVDDYTTIKTKMIERLLEIAENDGSATARHRAIQTLLKYAEEGAERHVTSDPETDIAAIVKELTADVEAQVAIDRPSVAGEKNRSGISYKSGDHRRGHDGISRREEGRPPVFRAAGSGFFRPDSRNFSPRQ